MGKRECTSEEITFRGVSLAFQSGSRVTVVMRFDDEVNSQLNDIGVTELPAELRWLVEGLASAGSLTGRPTKITLQHGYLLYFTGRGHLGKEVMITIELSH